MQLYIFLGDAVESWPCPDNDLIAPCICSSDSVYNLDMDCSNIMDEDQLDSIFDIIFPFDDLKEFTIDNVDLQNAIINLTINVFDDKSFQSVKIKGTTLERIEDNVFINSHSTLTALRLQNNKIASFPFEIIAEYSKMTILDLSGNQITALPKIRSSSLLSLVMNHNANLELSVGEDTFTQAPNLKYIRLAQTGLKTIPQNLFITNVNLLEVYLNGNNIVELNSLAINPTVSTITKLDFSNNNMSTVQSSSIQGVIIIYKTVVIYALRCSSNITARRKHFLSLNIHKTILREKIRSG